MHTDFRFRRADFLPPPAHLRHMEIELSFGTEFVDGTNSLTLVAREALATLALDAQELDVFSVERCDGGNPRPLAFRVDPAARKLHVELGGTVAAGTTFVLRTRTRCRPSDTHLEGLYRDITPAGAPPQFVSQCQQWGFQRILPVIDDCTAKCTFRTTLEGDRRYTHLISNGDIDRQTNPDGRPVPKPGAPDRQVITYVNRVPMAPYLFLACAGTWDVLADEVEAPDGRRVRLEYLVPPGRTADARLPLAILKDSVRWQQRTQDYAYRHDVYRTICMEKSNYGGMENVGNTTIVTEAALIDAWTSDARLIYAHGVIVHEFEHNQCGSDVTMATPFDMWLNEAFTVDVERQYLCTVFDPHFMRLREVDSIRAPLAGPLAIEDAGHLGRIVREGFNDPGELVDGLTYVKAAEVIRMLRLLLGEATFRAGVRRYFQRYDGGNADTDGFLACFEDVSGRDLTQFKREWLTTIGYPAVTARHDYDPVARRLRVVVEQHRHGAGGPFHLPLTWAAVDAEGRDLPQTGSVLTLTQPRQEWVFEDLPAPAFLSYNRDASFYGTFRDLAADDATLRRQVRLDPNRFNRVEAMRELTDQQRIRLLEGAATVDAAWTTLYRELLETRDLPDSLKGYLLQVDEQPRDRRYLTRYAACYHARQSLLRAAAVACGPALFATFAATDTLREIPPGAAGSELGTAIERRFLKHTLMELLCALDTPEAWSTLAAHGRQARNITDRLNALSAIWRSGAPNRATVLAEGRTLCSSHPVAYLGYLGVVGRSPRADVFEAVEREARQPEFRIDHPGHARALFIPVSLNNAQLWTPCGLDWLRDTVVSLATVNEPTALRLLAACQQAHDLAPELRDRALAALAGMQAGISATAAPALAGRIAQYRRGVEAT